MTQNRSCGSSRVAGTTGERRLRSEVVKDAELLVLRHENAVRRSQIAGPVRYEPALKETGSAAGSGNARWGHKPDPGHAIGFHQTPTYLMKPCCLSQSWATCFGS